MKYTKIQAAPHLNNTFNFRWHLGNFCNYHCSYCLPILNSGDSASFVPLDTAKKVLDNVAIQRADKDIMLVYSGGEPTVHPDFIELVQYSVNSGMHVSVISNGSRSLKYYQSLAAELNGGVVLSFHAEYADPEKFIQNVTAFEKNRVLIFVPMNEQHWDKCVYVFEQLYNLGYQAWPKVMIENFGDPNAAKSYEYTPEHQQYMIDANKRAMIPLRERLTGPHPNRVTSKIYRFKNKQHSEYGRINVQIEYKDGTSQMTTSHQILVNGLNDYKGMTCYMNDQSLNINILGNVFSADCRDGGIIGNIHQDPYFVLPSGGHTCTKDNCWCVDDLTISKYSSDRISKSSKTIPIKAIS